MTTNVRMFVLAGVHVPPAASGNRLAYDSVQVLKLPYMARALLTCDGVTPQTSDSALSNNQAAALLYVQVDPGKRVYYELTPGGRAAPTLADTNSPIMQGDATLIWGPNWQLSVLEVT